MKPQTSLIFILFTLLLSSVAVSELALDNQTTLSNDNKTLVLKDIYGEQRFNITSTSKMVFPDKDKIKWDYLSSSYDIMKSKDKLLVKGNHICKADDYIITGTGFNQKKVYQDCIYYPPLVDSKNFTLENKSVITSSYDVINIEKINDYQVDINVTFPESFSRYDPTEANFTEGMQGCWSFENDTSIGENTTLFYDYSGNDNNGTIVNIDGDELNESGKIGGALDLDEGSDYAFIQDDPSFDGTEITVSAWVKPKVLVAGDYGSIIDKEGTNPLNEWSLIFDTGATPKALQFWTYDGDWVASQSTTTFNENSDWFHVVAVKNATHNHVYINGTLQDTDAQGNIQNNVANITIGRFSTGGRELNATVDEVVFWNRALNSSEITELYNNGTGLNCTALLAGQSDPPVVNWFGLEPQNNTIHNGVPDNPLVFYAEVNTSKETNCTFSNNFDFEINVSNVTRNSNNSAQFNYTIDNNEDATYQFTLSCTNNDGTDEDTNKTIVIDALNPDIVSTLPSEANNTQIVQDGNLLINATCSDTNLFEFEANTSYFNSSNNNRTQIDYFLIQNISGTSQNYTKLLDLTGNVTGDYRTVYNCGDDHTLNDLQDLEVQKKQNKDLIINKSDKEVFNLEYASNDKRLLDYVLVTENNQTGVYKVEYYFIEDLQKQNQTHKTTLRLRKSSDLWLRDASIAHFVWSGSGIYLDFAEEIRTGATVTVRDDAIYYYIDVETDKEFIDPIIGNNNLVTLNVDWEIIRDVGFACDGDPEPYLRSIGEERARFNWVCNMSNVANLELSCVSYITNNNELIQFNPQSVILEQEDVIEKLLSAQVLETGGTYDFFKGRPIGASSQIINVFFTDERLRHGESVTATVKCATNESVAGSPFTFSSLINPQLKAPDDTIRQFGQLSSNLGVMVLMGLVYIIILFLLMWGLTVAEASARVKGIVIFISIIIFLLYLSNLFGWFRGLG